VFKVFTVYKFSGFTVLLWCNSEFVTNDFIQTYVMGHTDVRYEVSLACLQYSVFRVLISLNIVASELAQSWFRSNVRLLCCIAG